MGEHQTIQQRLILIAESMARIRAATLRAEKTLADLYAQTIPRDSWQAEPVKKFGVSIAVGKDGQVMRVIDGKHDPNLNQDEIRGEGR